MASWTDKCEKGVLHTLFREQAVRYGKQDKPLIKRLRRALRYLRGRAAHPANYRKVLRRGK